MTDTYIRNAVVKSIHDGDTLTVVTDLGYRVTLEMVLRLNRIDAPELNVQAGKESLAYLKMLVNPGDAVVIQTYKDPKDKYGRWLAELNVMNGPDLININDLMVSSGHAVPYNDGKK